MFCAIACNPAVATIEYNSGQYIAVPTDVLVGVAGFEPTTSSSRTKRATGLRHTPMEFSRARISIYPFGEGVILPGESFIPDFKFYPSLFFSMCAGTS